MKLLSYQINETLYQSTQTIVYRATDGKQSVILKLPQAAYPSPEEVRCYEHEYGLLQQFTGKMVIWSEGLIFDQGRPILVLEDFVADSLYRWLIEDHSLSEKLAVAIKLTEAIQHIHEAGVIHRDINPSNVMLNVQTAALKLIDFDLATRLARQTVSLKNVNQLVGTLPYLSPEQTGRTNQVVDYRTDLYSLGVTLYQLFSGELPFSQADPLELIHAHLAQQPVPLSERVPSIPLVLSEIVAKLLAKQAADRYQSEAGLLADLCECARQLAERGQITGFKIAQSDHSGQLRFSDKLYGREVEQAQLRAAFERVTNAKSDRVHGPELLLVTGYSGIGKSALVAELRPLIRHGHFVQGKFDQYQQTTPYTAISQALDDWTRQLLTLSHRAIAKIRSQLLSAMSGNSQLLVELVPRLSQLLGEQPPLLQLGSLENQNRFQLALQSFMAVIATMKHSLVLFLDDVQWIDAASLKLLQQLLSDDKLGHLLVILAYRSNEVGEHHLLQGLWRELASARIEPTTLQLTNLTVAQVNDLVADSLQTASDVTTPLSLLIHQKTEGNPFFTRQFLQSLVEADLLTYDFITQGWQWDVNAIKRQMASENVVELLLGKLRRLPTETQHLLSLAASVDNQVSVSLLATVAEKSVSEVWQSLYVAVSENFMVGLEEQTAVRFVHDRIQQAAYELLPEIERPSIHLKIGWLLWADRSDVTTLSREQLFTIADHFKQGLTLLHKAAERRQVAELMRQACQQAKLAMAFRAAYDYCTLGRQLLPEDGWQSDYAFTLQVYNEAVEAAALSEHFEAMQTFLMQIRQNARTTLDQVPSYIIQIEAYQTQSDLQQALDCSLEALRLMGIPWSRKMSQLTILAALLRVRWLLHRHSPDQLLDLPRMTDAHQLALMELLTPLQTISFFTSPDLLLPLSILKGIELSLLHGQTIKTIGAYVVYGGPLLISLGDLKQAKTFLSLTEQLWHRLPVAEQRADIYTFVTMMRGLVQHHFVPLEQAIETLYQNYQDCLRLGEWQWASYSASNYHSYQAYYGHVPLSQTIQQCEQDVEKLEKLGLIEGFKYCQMLWHFLQYWQSNVPLPFDDNLFRSQFERFQLVETGDTTGLAAVYLYELVLRYSFAQFDQIVAVANKALQYRNGMISLYYSPLIIHYSSLALLAVYPQQTWRERWRIRRQVQANQKKMKQWATHAPENYQFCYLFVEAEWARAQGKPWSQIDSLYSEAEQLAEQNGFWRDTALINERWASFWKAQNRPSYARPCFTKAYQFYARWEATAKLKQLETEHSWLKASALSANRQITLTTSKQGSLYSSQSLDLASLFKANQAITSQVGLKQLLQQVMKLVLENAGADRGLLLLPQGEQWYLQAEATTDLMAVLQSEALSELPETNTPTQLINYVIRSQERLVLNQVQTVGDFTHLFYVREQGPQSILLLPLLNKGQLSGVLYLENRLSPNVFTMERLNLLNLLASQIAISLDNAWVYENLERLVFERTQQLETVAQLSEQINAILNMDELLQTVVDQVHSQFGYYHAHIYLFDDLGTTLQMIAATGSTGAEMKAAGHQIALNHPSSLLAKAARQKELILVENVHQRADWLPNPLLPDTQAELVVPIIDTDQVLGVLDVQSDQVGGLDEGDGYVLRSLANQVAVAIKNAQLFSETLKAKQAAEVANQAKSTFLSQMSHELRTPLNGILGYAQILKRSSLDRSQKKGIETIHQSGHHLLTLINDILDLSKIEAGKMELVPTTLHLPGFLDGVVRLIRMRAEEKDVLFVYEPHDALPGGVLADEKRLRQVLINLLGNAIKFTEQGKVTLNAYPLASNAYSNTLRFEVADTGVGMTEEQLAKIFQPFEQVGDAKQRAKGTGLGLAITRQLVNLMGGDIQVVSQFGQGSTFWFDLTLPIVEVEPDMQPEESRDIVGYEGSRRTLLVVDDQLENRLVLRYMLSPLGFTIKEAENGQQAVHEARYQRADLILTDLVMPVMNGFEAVKQIRQFASHLPIIAISARAFEMDQKQSRLAGCDAFLPKPVDQQKLLALIETHLKLTWIYQEQPEAAVEAQESQLVSPPQPALEALYEAAKLGMMSQIRKQMDKIEQLDATYAPFAQKVRQLARGFEDEEIVALVEKYLN